MNGVVQPIDPVASADRARTADARFFRIRQAGPVRQPAEDVGAPDNEENRRAVHPNVRAVSLHVSVHSSHHLRIPSFQSYEISLKLPVSFGNVLELQIGGRSGRLNTDHRQKLLMKI